MTLQCMQLTDHVTFSYSNNVSTAQVFLDIRKAFDTMWHLGFLYKLFKLEFLASVVQPISIFLSNK